MVRQKLIAILLLIAATLACRSSSSRTSTAPIVHLASCGSSEIMVVAHDAEANVPISGARAVVVDAAGMDLATGITNTQGFVCISEPEPSDQPRLLLVEREGYFIGGLRWRHATREYYLRLVIETLR